MRAASLAIAGLLCAQLCARSNAQISLDQNCTLTQFSARINKVDQVCCPGKTSCVGIGKALPKTCSLACAEVFIPTYRDCVHTIDAVFDKGVKGDSREDGKASSFLHFEGVCASISRSSLVATLSSLQAHNPPCTMDMTGVIAKYVPSTVKGPKCKDNDAAMTKNIGLNCAATKAKGLCAMARQSQTAPSLCQLPLLTPSAHA